MGARIEMKHAFAPVEWERMVQGGAEGCLEKSREEL
jgi:hypothetical protein